MTTIRITAVETIEYGKDYDLGELEEIAGVTLAECENDLDAFAEALQDVADMSFCEGLEEDGEVQGQVWSARIVTADS